ncbi:hypothetical protein HQ533_05995 [Candidatus Woesearchaeota archaeon]|nr:hypothetical protein [Candidatus Woesearchaeota archaeon]
MNQTSHLTQADHQKPLEKQLIQADWGATLSYGDPLMPPIFEKIASLATLGEVGLEAYEHIKRDQLKKAEKRGEKSPLENLSLKDINLFYSINRAGIIEIGPLVEYCYSPLYIDYPPKITLESMEEFEQLADTSGLKIIPERRITIDLIYFYDTFKFEKK